MLLYVCVWGRGARGGKKCKSLLRSRNLLTVVLFSAIVEMKSSSLYFASPFSHFVPPPFLPSNKLHHHPGGPSGGAHHRCHVPQSRKERAAGGCGLIGAIHESSVLRNFWAPFGIGGSELYSNVHTGLWFGYALWIKKKLQSAI